MQRRVRGFVRPYVRPWRRNLAIVVALLTIGGVGIVAVKGIPRALYQWDYGSDSGVPFSAGAGNMAGVNTRTLPPGPPPCSSSCSGDSYDVSGGFQSDPRVRLSVALLLGLVGFWWTYSLAGWRRAPRPMNPRRLPQTWR